MYALSSLSVRSLPLSKVLVSDSSLSLPAKQSSSDSIPSCNVHFATSSENHCRRHACGGGDASGGGGDGGWWCLVASRQSKRNGYTLEATLRKCHRATINKIF